MTPTPTNNATATVAAATSSVNNISSSNINSSNSDNNESCDPLSFAEFQRLLETLRSISDDGNRKAYYERNYAKTFAVPCRMPTGPGGKAFNINKKGKNVDARGGGGSQNSSRKKKDDKYEFFMTSLFVGEKDTDGSIACKVESSLLEPYFGETTPGALRKLSRTEKARASAIVNDSSTKFVTEYGSLAVLHVRLLHTAHVFLGMDPFPGFGDIKNPTLLVVDRENGGGGS